MEVAINREQRRLMEQMRGKLGGVNPFYQAGRPAEEMMQDMPDPDSMEARFYPLAEFHAAYLISLALGMAEERERLEVYLKERVAKLVEKIRR